MMQWWMATFSKYKHIVSAVKIDVSGISELIYWTNILPNKDFDLLSVHTRAYLIYNWI